MALEIFATEKSYVASLQLLLDAFVKPLREATGAMFGGPCSDSEINLMFGGIESIVTLNEKLLKDIGEVVLNWSDVATVGPVFSAFAPYFKMYRQYVGWTDGRTNGRTHGRTDGRTGGRTDGRTGGRADGGTGGRTARGRYVSGFMLACKTAAHLQKNRSAFATFLSDVHEERRDDLKGQTLQSLMIMPVQRIPRYRMLLETLHKRTDDGHPDKAALVKAIEGIRGAAKDVDEHIAEQEGPCQSAVPSVASPRLPLRAST